MNGRWVPLLLIAVLTSACDRNGEPNRIVGQLESDRVEITAEVPEPVTEKLAFEGQAVTAGEPLMQQDTARVLARIAEAKAVRGQSQARLDELVRGPRSERIVAARADVQVAIEQLEFRETEYVRAVDLLERKLAAPALRDRTKSDLDTSRANLESAEARLEELLTGTTLEELQQAEQKLKQTEAQLESLNIDLARHRSLAPVDGVVDSILFEPGERPGPGQPLLVMLAGTQPYARVYVPEAQRANTRAGMSASIYVDGIAEPLDGRIRWVSSEAAFTPYFALTQHDRGRLTYLAKVDILNADQRLPDGVPVEVEIHGTR